MTNFRHIIAGGLTVLALVTWGSIVPKPVNAACGGPFPPKPQHVWAKSGPGGGQVTLYWDKVNYANRYAVAYGTSPGNYQYGATNIGGSSSTSYTVSGLSGGQYYFRIAAAQGCTSSPFSDEVSSWSSGGSAVNAPSLTGSTQTWSNSPTSTNSNVSAWSGPGIGEVTVKWWGLNADNYHLVYDKTITAGTAQGNYKYGALNIGKTDHIVVRSLEAAQKYNFYIIPVGGSRSLQTIGPVSAVAKYPVIIETSAQNVIQPVSMAEPEELVLEEESLEDADETGDVDQVDSESELYEEDNSNVQGMTDQSEAAVEYSLEKSEPEEDIQPPFEYYSYSAENQPVEDYQGELEEQDEETRLGGPVDY